MAEKDFQYYKKWALGVIKKQIAEIDKEEKKNKKIAKAFSLAEIEIEKAFPVGTIRTWKGKKFIKSPDKKWRPYYEKNDTTGAKRTLSLLAKKINALDDGDFKGLYNLLKLHESRFLGQGNQLMEIYKLAKNKGANVGKRFSDAAKKAKEKVLPKVEPKEEEKEEELTEKEKEEKKKDDIERIKISFTCYHESIRKDMKKIFFEPEDRTKEEKATLDNEAKVFYELYGKEWRKKGLGIWYDEFNYYKSPNESKEKWFQRIEETIDFVENYQNMKNSDDAIDAVGIACAGDFYLGQGDVFGDDKKTFTPQEKKYIKAYEALSGEKLPETKEEVVDYFQDKRKREPDWENNPPKTREERVRRAEKLAKKYGLKHPVIPAKEEKKEEKEEEKPKDEPKKEEEEKLTEKEKEEKEKEEMEERRKWNQNPIYADKIQEHLKTKDVEEALEGLKYDDKVALVSWIKTEDKIAKIKKHKEWIEHGFDVYQDSIRDKADGENGWSAASLKNKYERESKTFGKVNFSEQCIRHAWESPTEILPEWDSKTQTEVYVAYGNMGTWMNNGYMERFDQGETTQDLATGYTAIPFGTFTKEELAQFERIKPRIAALKRKQSDWIIKLHGDAKEYLKTLYQAKVKNPKFRAFHGWSEFETWRDHKPPVKSYDEAITNEVIEDQVMRHVRRPNWVEQKKLERTYGKLYAPRKSFCYFDKKGHLWIKKSALDAFMG